ncbi:MULTISPECIES: hypothetical protein [unclassified Streptomyces]|uniref:hypothetical protein n=1 Tax=unclassified Streptomyces TaxID=2593676 RepID=UPI000DC7DE53|nr:MULTISPECIES: hypothetical protein [unclassified Streptomyces]AWZ06858.1 hypothetical protein DRB89_22075 [Streptomyces sp. ICC4]AWZ14563.1 hypothetical protein DRB96_22455 [Streptomyces sp. ICC1]
MSEPFASGEDHPACGICPSKRLPREAFVVYDRPSWECPFNPADGWRYTADGTPACVHPHKIGVEPDRIAPPPKPIALDDEPAATPRPRRRWLPSFLAR